MTTERLAYSVAEAAQLLGVSENTVRAMINRNELFAVRMGQVAERGDLRVGRVEINRYLLGKPREEVRL